MVIFNIGKPKIERFEDSVFIGDYIMIPLKQKKTVKKRIVSE